MRSLLESSMKSHNGLSRFQLFPAGVRRLATCFCLVIMLGNLLLPASAAATGAKPYPPEVLVVTSIQPLGLLASELLAPVQAGAVRVIIPRSASPHGFSLQPSDMRLLVTAPVLLWLGPDLEPYLTKALQKRGVQPDRQLITAESLSGIRLLPWRDVEDDAVAGHHHHEADDHHHDQGQYDPHLWWDSQNALLMADALTATLSGLYPQWQQALAESRTAFEQRLTRLREQIQAQRPAQPKGFLIYHDSLLYLEKELGISSARRITQTPENKPSVRDMLSLSRSLNNGKVNCVITEPGVNPAFLRKLYGDNRVQETEVDPLGWDAESYTDMWFEGARALMECAGASHQ